MANTSVSFDSFMPTFLENISNSFPVWSLSMPPTPASPGFLLTRASTLNLKKPRRGRHQTSTILIRDNANKLPNYVECCLFSNLSNYSLKVAHLSICQLTTERRSP
eukprot:TRINITY_DN25733_c0_g1_i1.p1 TRINITY_DN25733_c0_g1~~TRINITY_DN25733_c0_g1_i1.p1  ORF type:complete len:106 (+),score=1.31 TRINITY_DN25733_c0_g1_i1:371-688(+)